MGKIEEILRRNRLRWLGHVHRMENNRFARQVVKWVPKGGQRKRGRPTKNWRATIEDDLNVMWMWWEEAEITSANRTMWRSCMTFHVQERSLIPRHSWLRYGTNYHHQYLSVWLAQLVKALAAPTHVHSCVQEVWVRSPKWTSSTLASIPPG